MGVIKHGLGVGSFILVSILVLQGALHKSFLLEGAKWSLGMVTWAPGCSLVLKDNSHHLGWSVLEVWELMEFKVTAYYF